MKLTKKILAATLLALAARGAFAAADSYLYWMVSPNVYNYLDAGQDLVDYKYAQVYLGNVTTTPTGSYSYDGGQWLSPYFADIAFNPEDFDSTILSGGEIAWGVFDATVAENNGYTFLFELINDSGDVAGWTTETYASLVSRGAIATGNGTTSVPSGASAYTLTGVVPEPTSGLLMLLGFAGLALRRRKQV